MSGNPSNISTQATQKERSNFSSAFAAFISGATGALLTIVGTLVGLASGASKEQLFSVLVFTMYSTAAATVLVLAWVMLREFRDKIGQLQHLQLIERFVPTLGRITSRRDIWNINANGDARLIYDWDVELGRPDAVLPWMLVSVTTSVDKSTLPGASIHVQAIEVDGQDCDIADAVKFLNRRTKGSDNIDVVNVRIPVRLGPRRTSCSIRIEINIDKCAPDITTREWFKVLAEWPTDELTLELKGAAGLTIGPAADINYLVTATSAYSEAADIAESTHQSSKCRIDNAIFWQTNDVKLGYEYTIYVKGS